jgi:hypothetical protein
VTPFDTLNAPEFGLLVLIGTGLVALSLARLRKKKS